MDIKAGLEIHQQLDTHKLFCMCPSVLRNDEPEFTVERQLHAVAGESGQVDIAALHEASINRTFLYEGFDSTCLVELDGEPPHMINTEALDIALHIALLLHCDIIPIAQIMRKTVIDGSNTGGFQRTVLIARNGHITTKHGTVRISNVSLEEDSARRIEEKDMKVVYRLDRLGIPLIEIGTEPDMKNPEQVKEVALQIGEVLRSCRVKRGIGTIRQDVNISMEGHPRVEIKGFQDVKMFIPVIEKEILRQQHAIKKKNVISEVRRAEPDGSSTYLRPMPTASRMYPETDVSLLRISRDIINRAKHTLPTLRADIVNSLEKKGLTPEMITLLLRSGRLEIFEYLLKIVPEPAFVVQLLLVIPKELASRDENALKALTPDILEEIAHKVRDGVLDKKDVKHVMQRIVSGMPITRAFVLEKVDMSLIESRISDIVREKPGLSLGGYMGIIMKEFGGKISGHEANAILRKFVEDKQ
jgi:Glu-tRNA(Gln) amidotransferase subunit E-like FAD-binding protein